MSETTCEPDLLLFAGIKYHAAGLLEPLKKEDMTLKKTYETIKALVSAIVAKKELMAFRFGSKIRVVFASSLGYASMPPALQFVYSMLDLVTDNSRKRLLIAAPNLLLEEVNLRPLKAELEARLADISHNLRGFDEFANILEGLEVVLCREVSNLTMQLKLKPEIDDDHHVISHLSATMWFRNFELATRHSEFYKRLNGSRA